MKIAVYCGSGVGNNPDYIKGAHELGQWIGKSGHTLVYGGGDAGLMGIVAKEVHDSGSPVIGVVPGDVEFIMARPQPYVTDLRVTENMSSRKQLMVDLADAYIALPGGIGTLDEISEVITLTKIGVFHKPSVLFNRLGFYEPFRQMLKTMQGAEFLRYDEMKHVLFSDSVEEIENFFNQF